MKNYFNSEERTRHIFALAAQEDLKELAKSDALTPQERRKLQNALKNLQEFTVSVCQRFGEPYRRKIFNTMQLNNIRLVAKGCRHDEPISHAAQEDLEPAINELRLYKCMLCEKEEYKDCAVYAICVACGLDGKGDSGCPFLY